MWKPIVCSWVSGKHLTCSPPVALLQVVDGWKIVGICWTLRSGCSAVCGKEAQGKHCADWMGTNVHSISGTTAPSPIFLLLTTDEKKKKRWILELWLQDDRGGCINARWQFSQASSVTRFLASPSSCLIRMTTERVIPLCCVVPAETRLLWRNSFVEFARFRNYLFCRHLSERVFYYWFSFGH